MPTTFHIDNDDTVRTVDQGREPAGLEHFASFEQFEQVSADWPLRRLVAVWNHLPGYNGFRGLRTAPSGWIASGGR